MWAIANDTPLSADRTWVRDRDGAEVWLVAAKATFLVREDGSLKLAPEQEPVRLVPAYLGAPGASGLRYDIDLVHRKVATDILVHGHAYAPPGARVAATKVGFRVGEIAKELGVFGDRFWRSTRAGLAMSEAEPFERLPVTWERAFGGYGDPERKTWDVRNPVGTGFAGSVEHAADAKLPNVEDLAALIRNWDDRPPPAGFGPVDRHWSARSVHAGTYDEAWAETRKPLLPDDFDDRYHQCAPADQQANGFLRGGEPVRLWNMTPSGKLSFRLPRVSVAFRTRFSDRTVADHRAELHSVILEPYVPRVILTWHSHLRCHAKVLKLLESRVVATRGADRTAGPPDDYGNIDRGTEEAA